MNTLLKCHNLKKIFATDDGDIVALDGVNLEVPADKFMALVGPSGCGKSTLLHIVAGLDTTYEGDVIWHGEQPGIAYLFQDPRLLPWLTAEENVAFVLQGRGERRQKSLEVAREYLALVDLDGFERQYPSQLSGGMRQRVAMARALAVQPDVILMDEPFGSLDELTARKLRAEVLRIFHGTSRTVLFVTHDVTEAAFLADRVAVMSQGPGRILTDIPVDLPRPRDYDSAAVADVARDIVHNLQLE